MIRAAAATLAAATVLTLAACAPDTATGQTGPSGTVTYTEKRDSNGWITYRLRVAGQTVAVSKFTYDSCPLHAQYPACAG